MSRTADYAIQGFLYQFNKTLVEILDSAEDSITIVEGVIEDVEVHTGTTVTATQCKYHEANGNFTLGAIYKPLLQMVVHFSKNQTQDIRYVLFAHFPNKVGSVISLSKPELEKVLLTKDKELVKYVAQIPSGVNLDDFLTHLTIQFAPTLENLILEVHERLLNSGIHADDIDTIAYPNAINHIANLSIKHDVTQREITKRTLVDALKALKKSAISRWTISLKTRRQIMESRRAQLKRNLKLNARVRHFVIGPSISNLEHDVVLFIRSYLEKFHSKSCHICTPLFCIDASLVIFQDVQFRLHQSHISVADGLVGGTFVVERLFREPLVARAGREPRREFHARLIRFADHQAAICARKPDDLFLIGDVMYDTSQLVDVEIEALDVSDFSELKYLLGMTDDYK